MPISDCNRCGAIRDVSDNYCRNCGSELTITMPAVPAVRATTALAPVKTVSIPPSVIRGVAVLAVGTGVEWVLRRMAGNAARAAGRSLIPGSSLPARQLKAEGPRDVTVDEILYVRKVQLRR